MKFKLYKDTIPEYSALNQILYNRGIELEDQRIWLNADWSQINDWRLLDEKKILQGIKLIQETMNNNQDIMIVVDSDLDGYTSSAILINYLTCINEKYVREHVHWIHHKGKEHGLADVVDTILETSESLSVVVCPDSASNDRGEHERLAAAGIRTLCLDHHEVEKDSDNAIVINVQLCDYPNKALTGAGVTWQFCRAFDNIRLELGETELFANKFIDLAALGDCADMAKYTEIEIRALINLGFDNLQNKFIKALAKKNEYILNKRNGMNYLSVAFAIVPFLNAITRSGTMEEKEIVFKAFLALYCDEQVEYSKRGHKGEIVPLYEEALLVSERVKRRQTKLQDESMILLEKKIEAEQLLDNKIILLLCEPGDVEKNIAGLCANKIQAKYQKPCAILTKSKNKDDKEYFYRGSMRNYSLSERINLKDDLESTNLIEFCAGHQGAAGLGIAEQNISPFLNSFNKLYEDVDQEPVFWVDYIWNNFNECDANKILDIANLNIYGQDIPQSLVALNRIPITADMITLMGVEKGHPTIKINFGNFELIKFGASQEEYEKMCGENVVLTAVCTPSKNEYLGKVTPQLLLEDYELDTEWIF